MRTETVYVPTGAVAPTAQVSDLLPLALSRPAEALAEARAVLAADPDPATASVARQAAGIVLRDSGNMPAALVELRASLALARRACSVQREADVRATLGAALVMAGSTGRGLVELAAAAERADGPLLATVRLRWGHVLYVLGRHDEALGHLRAAISAFRRGGDVRWEARALQNRCLVYLAMGLTERAETDAARAGALFRAVGQELESAHALHNQGLAAHQRGDLPLALSRLEAAAERYDAIGAASPDLAIDEAAVRLTAGLNADAVAGLRAALATGQIQPVKRAELLLAAASATLVGEPVTGPASAADLAAAAAAEFQRQRRSWWATRAALVGVQARYAAGERTADLLRSATGLARSLSSERSDATPVAHLLAGRLAADRGDARLADRHLGEAARCRRSGPALVRVTGWLAEALRGVATGQTHHVLLSCGRGLDALAEHRLTLGDTELRALASGHGRELAELALQEASARGPRTLLRWSERWRATALAGPPARPSDDRELATELAALRDVARRRDAAVSTSPGFTSPVSTSPASTSPASTSSASTREAALRSLDRELERREALVRQRQRRLPGGGVLAPRPDIRALLAELEDGAQDGPAVTLLELVSVGGELHVLVAGGGRVRREVVGRIGPAEREVDFARAALRRAAYSRPLDLATLGPALQDVLLGAAARALPQDASPVVVAPPGPLHAAPWSLLPALAHRPVSVVPSAGHWLRARGRAAPRDRRIALVHGPHLGTGGAEIPALADRHPDAAVLGSGTATADRVIAALDGAWLAHVAAHGVFRADSPLFSCLQLDDGPLLVHDLGRLRRAPYRLVLSACDTAVAAPVGAGELLGLVTSLLALGTAGIVASVTPVNDQATVPLMVALHAALDAGAGLPTALLAARQAVAGDPVAAATGSSFLALGV